MASVGAFADTTASSCRLESDLFRLETCVRTCMAELRARRKPLLELRFDGLFLLRFADRQFLAVLFQLPPRRTRFEPYGSPTTREFTTA